jgi:transposase
MKDKYAIIKLKEEGHSNHEIQRMTGIHRKTVAKYWREYQSELSALEFVDEVRNVQERIVSAPRYDTSSRRPLKYTQEIDAMIDVLLEGENAKDHILGGSHKQKLTNVQIYGMVKAAGYDIGISVVSAHIKEKRDCRNREAFIRQEYEFGQRLEYDFGEVRLAIGGIVGKYHIAVLSSPRAGFRWAYLYRSQKKEAFFDSHVRFFEMAGGVYGEVVYDNMRNVVSRFIGRSEKRLNDDLIKASVYYGFRVNVTNCFSGNEKGHVEGSVKIIRNKVFAPMWRFESFEDAEAYLSEELTKMNATSEFETEKAHLLPYRPPLELAQASEQRVDKYSFIRVENNFYSVPEYLVGKQVLVKNYATELIVYSSGGKVCTHKKKYGFHEMTVDITHYIDTFMRKPGALKNSVALKSKSDLKRIFDERFTGREREFIAVIRENKDARPEDIAHALMDAAAIPGKGCSREIEDNVTSKTKSQVAALSRLFVIEGGAGYVN